MTTGAYHCDRSAQSLPASRVENPKVALGQLPGGNCAQEAGTQSLGCSIRLKETSRLSCSTPPSRASSFV